MRLVRCEQRPFVAIFVSLLFFYSLVSQRVERTILTAPLVFTSAGMLTVVVLPGVFGVPGRLPRSD